jgi:tetratricopeptide (TPR) repeat protein
MKCYVFFITVVGGLFSNYCNAQVKSEVQLDAVKDDRVIVGYIVEEKTSMSFGGSVRTYEVTDINMITPKELGQNNFRTITPRYAKVIAKAVVAKDNPVQEVAIIETKSNIVAPGDEQSIVVAAKGEAFVRIDVVDTYERIMDKGYKTVDMMFKVADENFFEGKMDKAAKWYSELFTTTAELEPIYYYRYGQSLIATGQTEKGNEMLELFKAKSNPVEEIAIAETQSTIILPVDDESTFVATTKEGFVAKDVVSAYEKIMDKGYKTADMMIKVADENFFEGKMDKAAKWYSELFTTTAELEPIYYYRYGQSLIATGQTEKGAEMMRLFKSKS